MVTALSLSVHSTVALSEILNRQLKNTSVLALEKGSINGSVDVIALSEIRLFCINLDKTVAIHAERRPGNIFFSIDLSSGPSTKPICAQGVSLLRKALFGFNSNLRDLDLILPSSTRMCTIAVPTDVLERRLSGLNFLGALNFLDRFNVLSNDSVTSPNGVISLLSKCWNSPLGISRVSLEDEILSSLAECLTDKVNRKVAPPLERKDRHAAALGILSVVNSVPYRYFQIQDLADLLHQSRTYLYSACKEKFGMSPVQVVRSVRLRQANHALSDAEFCLENNLFSVSDVAQYYGFASRSQFTKYYKIELMETPGQTLSRRRHEEKNF